MTLTSQSARAASSLNGTPDDAFLGNRISSQACRGATFPYGTMEGLPVIQDELPPLES